jgi:hypothetical protein
VDRVDEEDWIECPIEVELVSLPVVGPGSITDLHGACVSTVEVKSGVRAGGWVKVSGYADGSVVLSKKGRVRQWVPLSGAGDPLEREREQHRLFEVPRNV